jgi:hypothetical protein
MLFKYNVTVLPRVAMYMCIRRKGTSCYHVIARTIFIDYGSEKTNIAESAITIGIASGLFFETLGVLHF